MDYQHSPSLNICGLVHPSFELAHYALLKLAAVLRCNSTNTRRNGRQFVQHKLLIIVSHYGHMVVVYQKAPQAAAAE
jgi:hypothetical protein